MQCARVAIHRRRRRLLHSHPCPQTRRLKWIKAETFYIATAFFLLIRTMLLTKVRVASQYNRLTDGKLIGRSVDDAIEILRETNTDYIFHGWERYFNCPGKCSDLPPGTTFPDGLTCDEKGYSYEYLKNSVLKTKQVMPDVIFEGGLMLEFLNKRARNPLTGETFSVDDTWGMALDPSNWNIKNPKTGELITKGKFQTIWAIGQGWVKEPQSYNPKEQMPFYFPDVTNEEYQNLLLSWIKKQIDCGVDAIWIDMLFKPSQLLGAEICGGAEEGLCSDAIKHPAVKESYDASSEIINEIHKYGLQKYNKDIYVITWTGCVNYPYYQPGLDIALMTISSEEISLWKQGIEFSDVEWNDKIKKIREKLGNIPIFVRLDYVDDSAPLAIFSQHLTSEEQREFLRYADDFCQKKGIIFIYPIHGGVMGESATKLSFSQIYPPGFNWYDSLAPEFQTYETIKELALAKKKKTVTFASVPAGASITVD